MCRTPGCINQPRSDRGIVSPCWWDLNDCIQLAEDCRKVLPLHRTSWFGRGEKQNARALRGGPGIVSPQCFKLFDCSLPRLQKVPLDPMYQTIFWKCFAYALLKKILKWCLSSINTVRRRGLTWVYVISRFVSQMSRGTRKLVVHLTLGSTGISKVWLGEVRAGTTLEQCLQRDFALAGSSSYPPQVVMQVPLLTKKGFGKRPNEWNGRLLGRAYHLHWLKCSWWKMQRVSLMVVLQLRLAAPSCSSSSSMSLRSTIRIPLLPEVRVVMREPLPTEEGDRQSVRKKYSSFF